MADLTRICVGNDFTSGSGCANRSAATLARSHGAHLDLVHVVPPLPLYERVLSGDAGRPNLGSLSQRALERLQSTAAASTFAGLSVSCAVRTGVPFVELIAHAREQEDDLILVGEVGDDSGRGPRLGGTAERVLRKAQVPVWIARGAMDQLPQTILAPTDFSEASLAALRQAITLAGQWNARLVVVHVIEPIAQLYGWGAELAGSQVYGIEPEALAPEWLALSERIPLPQLPMEQLTVRGFAADTLVGVARERQADLIVIGTHGRSALPHALLGSVAEAVARRAPCSVLSVRHDAFTFRLP